MNFMVVVDQNYGIGKNNKLLTHLTDDLKYFRQTTLGKVVVMGRRTLESLPGGKAFDNRVNIVMTRDLSFNHEGAIIVHSLEDLFSTLAAYPSDDVFIVGGGQIYNMLYPYCRYGYITKIHEDLTADTKIDVIDELPNWELVWQSEEKENNGHTFVWTRYENMMVKAY
ncbi:MAG: dihydrofolate reductase [Vallitaleaceae bacterium]|jgi:dihydrofolate reductase|nr:dihydrofolate reductase [Vallitaleaceae bacterium]